MFMILLARSFRHSGNSFCSNELNPPGENDDHYKDQEQNENDCTWDDIKQQPSRFNPIVIVLGILI